MKFINITRLSDKEEISVNVNSIIMIELYSIEEMNSGGYMEFVNYTKLTLQFIGELIIQENMDYVKKLIGENNFN